MASPALGPTPDTAVSSLKQLCCSSVAKPYRAMSFSVTFSTVYSVAVSPAAGRRPAVVWGTWARYPTPAQLSTTLSNVFLTILPVRQ